MLALACTAAHRSHLLDAEDGHGGDAKDERVGTAPRFEEIIPRESGVIGDLRRSTGDPKLVACRADGGFDRARAADAYDAGIGCSTSTGANFGATTATTSSLRGKRPERGAVSIAICRVGQRDSDN
eukprot:scaffold3588_cov67-Phaeocystis_antarctica.AAC.7